MYFLDLASKNNQVTVAENRNNKTEVKETKRVYYSCSSVVLFKYQAFFRQTTHFISVYERLLGENIKIQRISYHYPIQQTFFYYIKINVCSNFLYNKLIAYYL